MRKQSGTSVPQNFGLRWLNTVQSRPVDWLWHGWVARNSLCVVTGHPDTGKSWLTLHLASEVTRAGGNVLLIDAENAAAQVLVPRLELLGANLDRVALHDAFTIDNQERHFDISRNLKALDDRLQQVKFELVCIDPLNAYLGLTTDTYRDAAVRTVLGPLARLTERHELATICVVHGTKAAAELPLYRIQGSVAYGAAARTVILVARQDESERRTIMLLKNNLIPESEKPKPQDFDLSCGFRWLGDSPPPKLPPPPSPKPAETFLESLLADGPLPSSEVLAAAEANGIHEQSLKRARASLGIRSFQINRIWYQARAETPYSETVYGENQKPQRDESPPRATCPRHQMALHQLYDGRWCHEVWPIWP